MGVGWGERLLKRGIDRVIGEVLYSSTANVGSNLNLKLEKSANNSFIHNTVVGCFCMFSTFGMYSLCGTLVNTMSEINFLNKTLLSRHLN